MVYILKWKNNVVPLTRKRTENGKPSKGFLLSNKSFRPDPGKETI
ncbi:hypothetical protein SLEP1_g10584 [Rubroshorea leprosula]|uniref:Uncharacterized protein n=1 Tax=Rubroshorea leprosula TaxID=152421 RepID=A0AAV5IH28_9ROSI|nr:hypothetical protein SLEP1_g10584 [Rubroshorea leprosula]